MDAWKDDPSITPHRKRILGLIHARFRNSHPHSFADRLPDFARRLEAQLLRAADSLAVYLDESTLEARLQDAGRRMVAQRQAAQQQAAAAAAAAGGRPVNGEGVPGPPPFPGGGPPAYPGAGIAPPHPPPSAAAPAGAPGFMSNGAPVLLRGAAARGSGGADGGGSGGWAGMVPSSITPPSHVLIPGAPGGPPPPPPPPGVAAGPGGVPALLPGGPPATGAAGHQRAAAAAAAAHHAAHAARYQQQQHAAALAHHQHQAAAAAAAAAAGGGGGAAPGAPRPPQTAAAAAAAAQRRDYIARQQRWLLFLRHCAKCEAPEGACPYGAACTTAKALWHHILACAAPDCAYPRCVASRELLKHHQKCVDPACPVCTPVKQYVQKQRAAALVAAQQAANGARAGGLPPPPPPPAQAAAAAAAAAAARGATPAAQQQAYAAAFQAAQQAAAAHAAAAARAAAAAAARQQQAAFAAARGGSEPPPAKRQRRTLDLGAGNRGSSLIEAFSADEISSHLESLRAPNGERGAAAAAAHAAASRAVAAGRPPAAAAAEAAAALASGVGGVAPLTVVPGVHAAPHGTHHEDDCAACGAARLTFEPPSLYCTGCAARIKRNQAYYALPAAPQAGGGGAGAPSTTPGPARGAWCHACVSDPARADRLECDGAPVRRADLEKRRNDEDVEEGWVQCDACERWVHQVCGLFNRSRNLEGIPYLCPMCLGDGLAAGARKPIAVRPQAMLEARDLPRCDLSDFLERRLGAALAADAAARDALAGREAAAAPPGGGGAPPPTPQPPAAGPAPSVASKYVPVLTLRVINNVTKRMEVKPRFADTFGPGGNNGAGPAAGGGGGGGGSASTTPAPAPSPSAAAAAYPPLPASYPYRQKVIMLFQRIDGVDVALYCLYVQEYPGGPSISGVAPANPGACAPPPNARWVYLSYLDSVKYFTPGGPAAAAGIIVGDGSGGEAGAGGGVAQCFTPGPPPPGGGGGGEVALRTLVYHEILTGYLAYAKRRGYTSMFIWACPPLQGDDYILYCHPGKQKTPRSDRLREWYFAALRRSRAEGVVSHVSNLVDTFFDGGRDHRLPGPATARALPYFEGDYWPGEAEHLLAAIEADAKLASAKGKRAAAALGGPPDAQLMARLGDAIGAMRDDFIIVHLAEPCSFCRAYIGAGGGLGGGPAGDPAAPNARGGVRHPSSLSPWGEVGWRLPSVPGAPPPPLTSAPKGLVGPGGVPHRFVLCDACYRLEGGAGDPRPTLEAFDKEAEAKARAAAEAKAKAKAAAEAAAKAKAEAEAKAKAEAGDPKKEGGGQEGGGAGGDAPAPPAAEPKKEGEGAGPAGDDPPAPPPPPAPPAVKAEDPTPPPPAVKAEDPAPAPPAAKAEDPAPPPPVADPPPAPPPAFPPADPSAPRAPLPPGVDLGALVPFAAPRLPDASADEGNPDAPCEFFDTRQAFLSLCQGNHYQFDALRRAKHSSMMVLYHLHNPDAPAFACTCNVCGTEIEAGAGWRCTVCPDWDACARCAADRSAGPPHPHPLVPHARGGDRGGGPGSESAAFDATRARLTDEQRAERAAQLARTMALLRHASGCTDPACASVNCAKVKGLFHHAVACPHKVAGGCPLCRRMWALLQIHAKQCSELACPVPRCRELREARRRQAAKADEQRRAAYQAMLRGQGGGGARGAY